MVEEPNIQADLQDIEKPQLGEFAKKKKKTKKKKVADPDAVPAEGDEKPQIMDFAKKKKKKKVVKEDSDDSADETEKEATPENTE